MLKADPVMPMPIPKLWALGLPARRAPAGWAGRGVPRVGLLVLLALGTLPGCRKRQAPGRGEALPASADPALRRAEPSGRDPRIYSESRPYMGTLFQVTVALEGDPKTDAGRASLATSRQVARQALRAAFREVERIEALLSSYRPDSAVSRINRAAARAPTRAVKVDREVFNLIHQSLQFYRRSGGAFDITFGALADLWTPRGKPPRVPTAAEVRAALTRVGSGHIVLDYDALTVRLAKPGMRIGLGAIAKGYAVDQVVRILRAHKLSHFIVDGGGDLYVAGQHPDRPWRVGIKDPRKPGTHFASFAVRDRAVVTSGDYERFFMAGGRRYHHILDPRTGSPARGLMSVTVVGPSATQSDALATAGFVLGPQKGYAFIMRFADTECLLVTSSGRVIVSPGLRDRIKRREPTVAP